MKYFELIDVLLTVFSFQSSRGSSIWNMFLQLFEHLPGVNKVAQDFCKRLSLVLYDTEVTDLATEIGLWNFETSALLVLDKRLGGLEMDSTAERLSRQIVMDNLILFKYSGLLKLSFPFYKVILHMIYNILILQMEQKIHQYTLRFLTV